MNVKGIKKMEDEKGPYRRPNILFIMVDEQRFPPSYEDSSIKIWREEYLEAQKFLRKNGVEFMNHYAASNACSPSRTSLYTGQYPSLHGVTQTDGGGSTAASPYVFWLDQNTVPTFGDYLRTVDYDTYWKGKWHASHADIQIPGTHESYLSYEDKTGIPIEKNEEIYIEANRLNEYGFNGWLGPEPHGSSPLNSGSSSAYVISGRDEIYSEEVIKLFRELEDKKNRSNDDCNPWVIMASFVNPHDITLFGAYSRLLPTFKFGIDSSVPYIPLSPTAFESLETKPEAQASYREKYPLIIQPLVDSEEYRRLYYSLQLNVDREINKVLRSFQTTSFYDDTIIIYTSDHGDMLGSHGGLFQKWFQAYEESIHVPLIIHYPKLINERKSIYNITSHVDILPTILEFAGIDEDEAMEELKISHTEVHSPIGRNLVPLILNNYDFIFKDEPIYFMTDDNPSITLNSQTFLRTPYEPVVQPNHIETVILKLPSGKNNGLEKWKYSRYFDNPQFWSNPGCDDESIIQYCTDTISGEKCMPKTKTVPAPDQIEMYNLTKDELEEYNLANAKFSTPESRAIQLILKNILAEECKKKRLYPTSGAVPGKPSCSNCGPKILGV